MAPSPAPEENKNLHQLDELNHRLSGASGTSDGLPELPAVRPIPGALRFMPPLIHECWTRRAYVTMDQEGNLFMEGFYKNGAMKLEVLDNNQIVAEDRRGKKTTIKSFDDLVKLNYLWWKNSITKSSYPIPGRPWADHFLEKGLVKRRVIFVPHDEDEDRADATA